MNANRIKSALAAVACLGLMLAGGPALAGLGGAPADADAQARKAYPELVETLDVVVTRYDKLASALDRFEDAATCHNCRQLRGLASYSRKTMDELRGILASPAFKRPHVYGKQNGLVNATRKLQELLADSGLEQQEAVAAEWQAITAEAHALLARVAEVTTE